MTSYACLIVTMALSYTDCKLQPLENIDDVIFFLLDMFIQHTAFLLDKGSQDRRRGILPPAVYCDVILHPTP